MIWFRDLCTNCRRNTVPHCSETTRSDHGSRKCPSIMLSSPHLMCTDSCGDNDILLERLTEIRETFDHGLRFNQLTRLGRIVNEGESFLPLLNLRKPFISGRFLNRSDVREEKFETISNITFDGLRRLDDFIYILWHDFEMDDPTASFHGSSSSLWCEGR